MGNIAKLLMIIMVSALALSCTKKGDEGNGFNDPKIPGGAAGGEYTLTPITNLTADTKSAGQVSFKYKIPSLYSTLGGTITVYRKNCDPNGFAKASCFILEPSGGMITDPNEAFKIGETNINAYIDLGLTANNPYTYWFFIKTKNGWSPYVQTTITTKPNQITFEIDPPKFWEHISWLYGYPAIMGNVGMSTLSKSISTKSLKKGGIALNTAGTVLAVADTDFNRVVLYANQAAIKCDPNGPNFDYVLCISLSFNGKLTPIQVLGQPDFVTTKSCAQHITDGTVYWDGANFDNSYCLTAPSAVFWDGNNLVVADTGNNRIAVYKNVRPNVGCEHEISPGTYNATKCRIDKVVGQRSLTEIVNYTSDADFVANGDASLNSPQGVFVHDGNLYIADTHNHRVVMVSSYIDDNRFLCANVSGSFTWKTPSCRFTSLLGQQAFTERVTFKGQMADCTEPELSIMFDRSSEPGNRILESKKMFLRRHFANPVQIQLTDNNEIYVAANEDFIGCRDNTDDMNSMELKSRILYFQNNVMLGTPAQCNNGSFLAGGCDSDKILGQHRPQEIPIFETSSDYTEGVSYGLDDVKSFLIIGKDLMVLDQYTKSLNYYRGWKALTTPGFYRTYLISNPNGDPLPADPDKLLPDLQNPSDIVGSTVSNMIYVSDLGFSKVYEIKPLKP